AAAPPAHPSRFVIPASREKRYVRDEVLIEIPSSLTPEALQSLEQRLGLTRIASRDSALLGSHVNRYRIVRPRSLPSIVRTLRAEALVAGAQPNYMFALQQAPQPAAPSTAYSLQYAVAALHLAEAHRLATGKGIRIAIIDSGIDGNSFGIEDRIVARLDTLGGPFEADLHGTAIAGAIVAHGLLTGVAPDAQVIAVRAFTGKGGPNGAEATSDHILQGLEFAVAQNANIVNMSFAGPDDALLDRALESMRAKGVAEIAAAGNGGPQSAPLYPGAEPGVIAVTATDQKGRLFGLANHGGYVALAAPGVDILLPAPKGSVQIASGTSIAAAHVTGVAALALERYGTLTPDALVKALDAGAHMPDAAARPEEYGAGVIDAYEVVQAKAGAGPVAPPPAASAASP
ncbi:MAG: S8 family serine peptidase, partial [Hyphomicrobiales bacterium]